MVLRSPGNRVLRFSPFFVSARSSFQPVLRFSPFFVSAGAVCMSRSRWIFDAPRDLTLFVATPVLILPLAFLICAAGSDELFVLLVAAFGQVGHNLPGLIRAYGDRDLFRRFRGRFILAPLLLGTACVFAAFQNLNVLVLAGVSWAIWHALMQTYGFVRIYASRGEAGSSSSLDAWLDFAMCVLWFGGAILLNERPLLLMLGRWYSSGGFVIPGPLVESLQAVWRVALIGVSVAWLGRALLAFSQKRGEPVRVGLMLTSIAFYWNAYAWTSNLLVGAAMFEIFHDVQYLAIVWMFNRRRVEQQAGVSRFIAFLFRRSGALVGCYVSLCFAFGSLKFFEGVATGATRNILIAFLATSGLLHFYYDGFIWKIRDASTRRSLDLDASKGISLNVPAAFHAMKWAAFLLPVLWLANIELRTRPDEASRWLQLTQSMPDSRAALVEAARLLAEKGDDSKACLLLHRAVMLAPDDLKTRLTLARLLLRQGRPGNALSQCQHVLSGEPSNSDARLLASRLLAEAGQLGGAEIQLRLVLDLEPERTDAIANLGIVLALQNRNQEAVDQFKAAIARQDEAETHFNLANVLVELDRTDDARAHYETALRLRPRYKKAEAALARLNALHAPQAGRPPGDRNSARR
jgi:Flp pilus assembly protein TadD